MSSSPEQCHGRLPVGITIAAAVSRCRTRSDRAVDGAGPPAAAAAQPRRQPDCQPPTVVRAGDRGASRQGAAAPLTGLVPAATPRGPPIDPHGGRSVGAPGGAAAPLRATAAADASAGAAARGRQAAPVHAGHAAAATKLVVGAVVDDAVTVIVVGVAGLDQRRPRHTGAGARGGVALAPAGATRRAHALVGHAVAIVVIAVAHLGRPRVDRRAEIIAVTVAVTEAGARFAVHLGRVPGDAVAVTVLVFAEQLHDDVVVHHAVAIIVLAVAQLRCAGVHGLVEVVAIPRHGGVPRGQGAVLARWISRIVRAKAVAVLVQIVGVAGAAPDQHGKLRRASAVPARRVVAVRRQRIHIELDARHLARAPLRLERRHAA